MLGTDMMADVEAAMLPAARRDMAKVVAACLPVMVDGGLSEDVESSLSLWTSSSMDASSSVSSVTLSSGSFRVAVRRA